MTKNINLEEKVTLPDGVDFSDMRTDGVGKIVLREPGRFVVYNMTPDSVSVRYDPDGSNIPVRTFEVEERLPTYC